MDNPYEILEISEDATQKEIKRACQRLTVKYHPVKETGDIDKYYKVRAAYESITKKLSFAEQYHKFKNSYLGSDEEMNDLIKIYNKHKGDIKKIIDDHILCEYEDEDRIRRIVDDLVAQKRLRLFTKFKKRIPEKMKKKRNVNLNELMEVMSKNDEKRKDLISRLEEKYCNQLEK